MDIGSNRIITNISDEDIIILECGQLVTASGGSVDLSLSYPADEIARFDSIPTLLSSGTITASDGINNYTAVEWADLQARINSPPSIRTCSHGFPSYYDETSDKFLSLNRTSVTWGYGRNNLRSTWLRMFGSLVVSDKKAGLYVPHAAIIKSVFVGRQGGSGSWEILICKNYSIDSSDVLFKMRMAEETLSYTKLDLDIDIPAGCTLHCYHQTAKDGGSTWEVYDTTSYSKSASSSYYSNHPWAIIDIGWVAEE